MQQHINCTDLKFKIKALYLTLLWSNVYCGLMWSHAVFVHIRRRQHPEEKICIPTHRVSVQSGKPGGTAVSDLWLQSTTLPRHEQADGHSCGVSDDIPSSAVPCSTTRVSATSSCSVHTPSTNPFISRIITITTPIPVAACFQT